MAMEMSPLLYATVYYGRNSFAAFIVNILAYMSCLVFVDVIHELRK